MKKVDSELWFICNNECNNNATCDGYNQGGGGTRCRHQIRIDGLARCKNKKVHEYLMLEKHKEYL